MYQGLFAGKLMLARGLSVFSSLLLSVVKQGSGTGCWRAAEAAVSAWDFHPL